MSNQHANNHNYSVVELFAGAGGLALGFEQAGFKHAQLNELDKTSCHTLLNNRPHWPVIQGDIREIDFNHLHNGIDVVAGGFPCQAFSYAGNKKGLADPRGQLFFEYARAISEIKPKMFIAENVKGLASHKGGRTLVNMLSYLSQIGYNVSTAILKAMYYDVPQKRERLFIVGIREDICAEYAFPKPKAYFYTLRDAMYTGNLYDTNVSISEGFSYSEKTKRILELVPEGGNWRDLPLEIQQSYLGHWRKRGSCGQVAKRLAWNAPCPTLLTQPASKLIDRCHPNETRPLTIREYARIQTFPDSWQFIGSRSAQYRQIGNAVPVHLAKAIACSVKETLSQISVPTRQFPSPFQHLSATRGLPKQPKSGINCRSVSV